MDQYDVSRLADAFEECTFKAGEVIVKQGEEGNVFYVIEEGECDVEKNGERVNHLKAGDYFGELALIRDQQLRHATVTATVPTRCVSLDRHAFNRLIPQTVRDAMNTHAGDYLPGPSVSV